MPGNHLHVPEVAKPNLRRPSKEFAEAALALAREQWKTNAEILKAMGYEPDSKSKTLARLVGEEGSDRAGRALVDALKKAGVDTTSLPPMYENEDDDSSTWRDEWIRIGELLHAHSPTIYQQRVDELRPLADALERATKGLVDISRTGR